MKKFVWLLVFVFVFNMCFAETFIMLDGKRYVGKVISSTQEKITIEMADGKTLLIKISELSYRTADKPEPTALNQNPNTVPDGVATSATITDQELRYQQYLSYQALKDIARSERKIADETEDIKTIMAWEFGIGITAIVITAIVIFINGQSKPTTP